MAIPKTSFHNRSSSLPTTSHPFDVSIENHFRRLRTSQVGPSSSSSLCKTLCGVKDLLEQMNDMIRLPRNQQVFSHEHPRTEVEEVLDGSLALLDASSSVLDVLSQTKASVLDLESAFRRGSNDEGIHAYMMSRKKINKALSKCLVNLKKSERSCALSESEDVSMTVRMLKDAETISFSVLKSLLSYLMGKKNSQTRGWSLVAKLVKPKFASLDAENVTEIELVDQTMYALSEKHSKTEPKDVMKQLDTLEMVIQELGDCLESVSRCFVKTRVSLLNLLNQ